MPLPILVPALIAGAALFRAMARGNSAPSIPEAGLSGRYVDDGDGLLVTITGWPSGLRGHLAVFAVSPQRAYLKAAHKFVGDKDGDFRRSVEIAGESCTIFVPHGAVLGHPRGKLTLSARIVQGSGDHWSITSEDLLTLEVDETRFSVVSLARPLLVLMKQVAQADGPLVREEVRCIRELATDCLELSDRDMGALKAQLKAPATASLRASIDALQLRLPWLGADAIVEVLRSVCLAGGPINRMEGRLLKEIAEQLGMSGSYLEAFMKSLEVSAPEQLEGYLALLGLSGEPTRDELRAAWRRAAREFHPDRYNATKLPDAVRAMIARKSAEINAAYEALRSAFGYAV